MADSNTDTLTFTAGTGISINANPTTDTISITNTSPNVNQNLFETFNGDSGSYVAAAATDEFNIVGGTDISTSITGSTLTINYTGSGGAGTPGGNNTEVQFNNSGSFGGDSDFTYNSTTNTLQVENLVASSIAPPNSLVGTYSITSPTTITLNAASGAGEVKSEVPFKLVSKTVTQLGSLSASAGTMVYCTDESGGAIPAFYDGTNWRRVSDRAIVS